MATVQDYLYWRGGDTFDDRPFSIEDAFVFAILAYLDLDEALSKTPDAPFSELAAVLDREKRLTVRTVDGEKEYARYEKLFRTVASSKRFSNVRVLDLENTYDEKKTQFAAMRFTVPGHFSFIAFRGTDETITGWKEDFIATFTKTYAQERASHYLSEVLSRIPEGEVIYAGGHSKGGNLAMIGTAQLSSPEIKRFSHIYSFDGPGIAEDVIDNSILAKIQDRFTEVVPEFCIIGRLFTKKIVNCKIVKSDSTGLSQHNVSNWSIGPDGPIYTDDFDPASVKLADTIDDWIFDADLEQRKNFVDMFFDSMRSFGSSKFNEIGHQGPAEIESILVSMASFGKGNLKMAMSFPKKALFGNKNSPFDRLKEKVKSEKKEILPMLVIIAIGILFLVLPLNGLAVFVGIVMLIPVAYEVITTLKALKTDKWNFKEQRTRVNICLIIIGIYLVVMFKEGALPFIFSTALGIIFLIFSYRGLSDSRKFYRIHNTRMVFFALESAAMIVLSILTFAIPEQALSWYVNYIGIALIADGAFRLIMSLTAPKDIG